MKCQACGFTNEDKECSPFVEIEGNFSVVQYGNESWDSHVIEIAVYACPKCGTLKVNPADL